MNIEIHYCIVWEMKHDGRMPSLGKHEDHLPHIWWYTSYGGGHQLDHNWVPSGQVNERDNTAHDDTEGWVKRWLCPGRKD